MKRKITSVETAESFLSPKLGALRDPFLIKDMDEAAELVSNFITEKRKITIYGDYDADGVTATALLVEYLSGFGTPVSFYIPHRLEEGYGLNEAAIRRIAADNTDLIVTVDCGINALLEITLAKQLGMEVIVTDHHQLPPAFKPVCPTVNPMRGDCTFPFKELSGVGLAFYLAIAVRSRLREKGFFKDEAEPDLRRYLGLVALGTVADIVPLTEENRILVKSGLGMLSRSGKPGIQALVGVSGIKEGQGISADDIAFRLAPRLNAMGRLGPAGDAVRLMITEDEAEASSIATLMDSLNAQRQALQNEIFLECCVRIEKMEDLEERRTIVLFDPGWHRGVVGIVASKIVETFGRPTLLFAVEGELLRGSGRSINGFNLYRTLSDLGGLLKQFGGHENAAGVTLEYKNIEEFCDRFEGLARERIGTTDVATRIEADARLDFESIDGRILEELKMLPPFGCQNPQPVFWGGPVTVVSSRVVGKDHLKLKLRENKMTVDCIAFHKAPLHPLAGKSVDVLFHLETTAWQGREWMQAVIVDVKLNPDSKG
jgi:single-stranded-DNA-specific exonuclease